MAFTQGLPWLPGSPGQGVKPGEVLPRGRGYKGSKAASHISVRPLGCREAQGETIRAKERGKTSSRGELRVRRTGPCFKVGDGEATGGLREIDGVGVRGCVPQWRERYVQRPGNGATGHDCAGHGEAHVTQNEPGSRERDGLGTGSRAGKFWEEWGPR